MHLGQEIHFFEGLGNGDAYEVAPHYEPVSEAIPPIRRSPLENVRQAIIRRRAKGKSIPKGMQKVYQRFREIAPGAERKSTPVKIGPHPTIREGGPRGFLKWLRGAHPLVYAGIERQYPEVIGGAPVIKAAQGMTLGQQEIITVSTTAPAQDTAPAKPSWLQTIADLAKTYILTRQQKSIMDMQLKRAEQGLPPVDVATMAPTVRVIGDLPPQTKTMLTLAIIGIGAAVILPMFARRR